MPPSGTRAHPSLGREGRRAALGIPPFFPQCAARIHVGARSGAVAGRWRVDRRFDAGTEVAQALQAPSPRSWAS